MRLRNILIVVKDIEKSKKFYHDLFGLDIILDNDGNVILTEGLVLQDEKVWKDVTGKEVVPENNSCELYFDERNIEAFTEKLEKLYPETKYVTRLMTYSWGQKVIRFYDLDGNLIEVRTPMRGERENNIHQENNKMAAVLLRAASLAFVMVLGILLKKTGIVGNPARVLRKVEK